MDRHRRMKFRIERDPLGDVRVPADAYYGVQTQRAVENFPISGLTAPPRARHRHRAHQESRAPKRTRARPARPDDRRRAIVAAADEILGGRLRDQFVVDVYQAGAGTSHNMNTNEVLANRAAEILGATRGDYTRVHPNDHVNMGQSDQRRVPDRHAARAAARCCALSTRRARSPTALDAKAREFAACSRPAARTCRMRCRSRSARSSAATPPTSRTRRATSNAAAEAVARAEPRRDGGGHRPQRRRRLRHGAASSRTWRAIRS